MPTHQKATNKCNIDANKDQIIFDSNLAYLDHSLPPLGLFLQIKFIFVSLSQTHLFGHKERYTNGKFIKSQKEPKTPPFSHYHKFSPTRDQILQ
jgi:hypothetical protein